MSNERKNEEIENRLRKLNAKFVEPSASQKSALEKIAQLESYQQRLGDSDAMRALVELSQTATNNAGAGALASLLKEQHNILDHFAASLAPSLAGQKDAIAKALSLGEPLGDQLREASRLASERISETISPNRTLSVDYSVFKPKLPEYPKFEPRNFAQETIDLYQQKHQEFEDALPIDKGFHAYTIAGTREIYLDENGLTAIDNFRIEVKGFTNEQLVTHIIPSKDIQFLFVTYDLPPTDGTIH